MPCIEQNKLKQLEQVVHLEKEKSICSKIAVTLKIRDSQDYCIVKNDHGHQQIWPEMRIPLTIRNM